MCEPCGPVANTSPPSRRTRTHSSRSGWRAISSPSVALLVACGGRPWIARSAGAAKRRKVTIAETGLPGSPKTSFASLLPNHVGRPGRSATRQKRSSTPSSMKAPLTWSWGPTETPPEQTTRSAWSSASPKRLIVAAGSSPTWLASTTSAPAARTSACSVVKLESCSSPGASSAPASRSSSPVAITATRARRTHCSSARPAATAIPSSAGPSSRPGARTASPARRSSPARRTLRPALSCSSKVTFEPSSSTTSIGATASAPSGITAPVEIRTASPSPTVTSEGCPARDSPITRSVRPASPERAAKPSIALLARLGTSPLAITCSASTKPSASSTAVVSAGSRLLKPAISA